ncbi:hypothetical protein BDQ12DRAFT_675107 [Crucibulum laeve]|uniref:MARVEL domain-containing protein n=1 Tax=Crucibulum laeve TaxID=68775 RepID=A0A5C3MDI2_9AGAR|nr:hypothetical protein BDQ12DRAFT_675107 [Crucibulum laeve]
MTVRFGNHRLAFYVFTFLLSATVLGISANFAKLFLPNILHDFTIFSLVVPSLTIFLFLLSIQWAQPRTEVVQYLVLGILWLTMGAWSTDIIGHVQCDSLSGQMSTKNGEISQQSYCRQMKVVQAFSWAIFCFFVIAMIILVSLASRAQQFGRYEIWEEPIRELPWFGEMPGYYNTHAGGMHSGMPVGMPQYPMSAGGYPAGYNGFQGMPIQTPGHSIVIQPGMNGQPPTVTQVPMSA